MRHGLKNLKVAVFMSMIITSKVLYADDASEIVQQIQTDNIGGQIMLGILHLIVGFGIFGTIVMMTNERIRVRGCNSAGNE
jgi:hypothetical protein